MAFSTEIKIEAWRLTNRVAEVPVYFERRITGESKIKWYKDGVQIILLCYEGGEEPFLRESEYLRREFLKLICALLRKSSNA